MLNRAIFVVLLCCFSVNAFSSEFDVLESKIYSIIKKIEDSKLVFIRNKDEHSAKEAAAHIKRKYEFAILSPFTPSKKNWTLDFFIKEIASKSSSSGEPYHVKNSEGKVSTMESWIYSLGIK